MNVVNVGYASTNYYVIGAGTSRLLVDAGWPGTMGQLLANLRRKGIRLGEIRCLLATHYHPDHAGLVQELRNEGLRLAGDGRPARGDSGAETMDEARDGVRRHRRRRCRRPAARGEPRLSRDPRHRRRDREHAGPLRRQRVAGPRFRGCVHGRPAERVDAPRRRTRPRWREAGRRSGAWASGRSTRATVPRVRCPRHEARAAPAGAGVRPRRSTPSATRASRSRNSCTAPRPFPARMRRRSWNPEGCSSPPGSADRPKGRATSGSGLRAESTGNGRRRWKSRTESNRTARSCRAGTPCCSSRRTGALMLFYKVGPNPSEWWGEVRTSRDAGATWGGATKLPSGILGPAKNKPVQLPNGTIVSPSSTESPGTPSRWRIHFERSGDRGATWTSAAPPESESMRSSRRCSSPPTAGSRRSYARSRRRSSRRNRPMAARPGPR